MGRLDNKVAIVTGGARGIGRAIAELFAAEGAHLFIADIDVEAAEQTARLIIDSCGSARPLETDITVEEDRRRLLAVIENEFGRLDILVNNAGLNLRGDMRNVDDDKIEQMLETNLKAVMHCVRDAFPLLKASGNASIINMSSIMAVRHMPQTGLYSMTMGALLAYTRSLAVDLARFGIRTNAISPGYIETTMTEQLLRVPQFRRALEDRTPLRRLGQPEEVAPAALFLASEESSYITGACIPVDGGMSIGL